MSQADSNVSRVFTLCGKDIVISTEQDIYNTLRQKYYGLANAKADEYIQAFFSYNDPVESGEFAEQSTDKFIENEIESAIGYLISEYRILDVDREVFRDYYDAKDYKKWKQPYDEYAETIVKFAQYLGEVSSVHNEIERSQNEDSFEAIGNLIQGNDTHPLEAVAGLFVSWQKHKAKKAAKKAGQEALEQMKLYYESKELRSSFYLGIWHSIFNIHYAIAAILDQEKITHSAAIPGLAVFDRKRFKARVNNLFQLDATATIQVIPELFKINPYQRELYSSLKRKFLNQSENIQQLEKYFGVAADEPLAISPAPNTVNAEQLTQLDNSKKNKKNDAEKTPSLASKLTNTLKNVAAVAISSVQGAQTETQVEEKSSIDLVGEVTPFKGPEGNIRGYMFDSIVYATQEQAEEAKVEKAARVFEGVLYVTKAEADAARAAKADLEARTVDGVVYETREQADKVRAEKEELEACTVDGVRYASRELADQVRAENTDRAARTVDGVVYATRELAEQIRTEIADREARTVNGFIYATRQQADEAREKDRQARTVDGVEYATVQEAKAVRDADLAERTVDGIVCATKEEAEAQRQQGDYFREKLTIIFDPDDNADIHDRPHTFRATTLTNRINEKLDEWFANADENRLNEWKRRIETVRAQKTTPTPLAELALKEIEKRLSGDMPELATDATENVAVTGKTAVEDKNAPEQNCPAEPHKVVEKKNNRMIGIIVAAVVVVGVIMMLSKNDDQNAHLKNSVYINGTNVNVRDAPSLKNSSVIFQLNNESVRCLIRRSTNEKYIWYKIEKNGKRGWVYGRYVSE